MKRSPLGVHAIFPQRSDRMDLVPEKKHNPRIKRVIGIASGMGGVDSFRAEPCPAP